MVFGDRAERGETASSGIGEKYVDLCVALLNRVIEPIEIGEAGGVALDSPTGPCRSSPQSVCMSLGSAREISRGASPASEVLPAFSRCIAQVSSERILRFTHTF
jgi:hypothetical protein